MKTTHRFFFAVLLILSFGPSADASQKTQRFYFPAEGDHPPAILVRLPKADAEALRKLLSEEKVTVALQEVRNGRSGYSTPTSKETLSEILSALPSVPPLDDSIVFVADNWTGRPYLGISCPAADAKGQCAVWFWIWPSGEKGTFQEKLITINDGIPGAGKFVQLDILDPADASNLFSRMQVGTVRRSHGVRAGVPETFDFKEFVSQDGNFALDCGERVGTLGYFCSAQASLQDVVTIESQNSLYTLSQKALKAQFEAVDIRALAKAEVLKAYQTQVAAARAAATGNSVTNSSGSATPITDAMIGEWHRSRPYSARRQPHVPGSTILRAMGEDNLRALVQEYQRYSGVRP